MIAPYKPTKTTRSLSWMAISSESAIDGVSAMLTSWMSFRTGAMMAIRTELHRAFFTQAEPVQLGNSHFYSDLVQCPLRFDRRRDGWRVRLMILG